MNRPFAAVVLLLSSLTAGCAAEVVEPATVVTYDTPDYGARAEVFFNEPPRLVSIDPGVSVVEDYGTAVYYTDGGYWYADDGVWFHTDRWNGPWARVGLGVVPLTIVHRDHHAFVHYHAHDGATVWREHHDHGVMHHAHAPVRRWSR